MPNSDDRSCGGNDGKPVIILLTVDRTHKTDERVCGTRERFGGHGQSILDATIVQCQVHPLIGTVQHKTMRIGWLQIGIATLVGIAVDIDSRTGQIGVVWSLNVVTIRQRKLHIAYRCRDDCSRKPVTIIATNFILFDAEVEIVILQMLVAQPHLCKHSAEWSAIFCKGRCRLLIDFRIGSLHGHVVCSHETVGIRAVIISVFATCREVSFPHRIAENEFRCPEVVAADSVAFYAALDCCATHYCGLLLGIARSFGVIKQTVNVQVDAQLSYLSIIIGIEDVLLELVFLHNLAFRPLCIDSVFVVVGIIHAVEFAIGMAVILVECTKTVVRIDHIVYLQLWRPAFPNVL